MQLVNIKCDWGGHADLQLSLCAVEGYPNYLVVRFNGGLGTGTGNGFHLEMQAQIKKGYTYFILDCEKLTYLGSLGLGPLFSLLKTSRSMNGDVILTAIPNRIAETLSMLGLAKYFEVYPSLDEALKTISMR